MITAWVLGFVFSILVILLFLDTRDGYDKCVLKVWNLALFIIVSLIPIINIPINIVLIIMWYVNVDGGLWEVKEGGLLDRLLKFLNKPIK